MTRPRIHLPSLVLPRVPVKRAASGLLMASMTFVVLGTVSALWENPLFIRMTPTGTWEITALLLLSLLAGLFVVVHRPSCSVRSAGAGGIVGFLGIACPTCNTLLMLIVGGEVLLAYFEPIRLDVATAGILVLAVVTGRELILRRKIEKV
jgi:hypothetical protein